MLKHNNIILFLLLIALKEFNCENFHKIDTTDDALIGNGFIDVHKIKESFHKNGTFQKQLDLGSFPCKCINGICRCCTGPLWQFFGRKACFNVRYIREDFTFSVKITMNNETLYEKLLAGRNPESICYAPQAVLEGFKVCGKFSDIYFIGSNMNVCFEITGEYHNKELFHRTFNCMRFGSEGFKVTRPGDGIPLVPPSSSQGIDAIVDTGPDYIENYDEVLLRNNFDYETNSN